MSTPRPQGTLGDELANVGIGLLIGTALFALLLRGAGAVAAWATGSVQPAGGPEAGLAVLLEPGHPSAALQAPGLSPVAYWLTATLLIGLAAAAALWLWRMLRAAARMAKADPHRIPGLATRAEVARAASRSALMKRALHLRPSLTHAGPRDVGYRIGRSRGTTVWASVEDSILVIGPPRSGKGAHIVINTILDAPGPVVTTSTRPDNLTTTLRARQRIGPVAVFDPQQLAPGIPVGLRWSPIRGCEDPLTAMIRAAGLAAGTGLAAGGVDGGGFWEAKTRTALQSLLHAAALDRCPPAELFRWTLDPAAAHDAVSILLSTPGAAIGWGDSLQAMLEADPRTRDSIWQGVSLSLGALADPRVLDAVSPGEGEGFDPEAFLRGNGTLYLLATGAGSNNSAALVSALVEDLVETARRIAARSAGARLDPPLLLALDEIGNLAPLPSLPNLMAEGGGTGITTMPVLQSLAQARTKWSDNAAGTIWDSSIVKIVLGGGSNSRDLQDLSTLIGDRDEPTDSTTIGDRGSRSAQRSIRRVAIMPPDTIRTLPFGTGLIMLRAAPPVVASLRMWTGRPDARELRANRAEIEQWMRAPTHLELTRPTE
ncbi:type IV secretory system conjugative DNA transfer family protein [Cryobacterium zhongshanensis]|uniref:TraM recognition domain-containing protein n=1 Tax=Cryobacterium zhongshanensis TaxID=2928153 RepID=A0AA41UG07_9MICO|nr:TraM recognition domain-containing protein [Cryobacterium zhongshanensis]MCI4658505.1 TraM recognition domain-containing protein [Cryobacterium zhongshanensis]